MAVLEERRAPRARIVAHAGTLDLDDLGAEVGEELADPGAGEDAAHVEHAYACERSRLRVIPASLIARRGD